MNDFVNKIDLKEIIKKTYNDFMELREDVGWFAHNCLVKYSNGCSRKNNAKAVVKAAEMLLPLLEQEIKNLLLCSECYENACHNPDDSFLMPCKTPHILLWANCGEYGFWPAKLMKCDSENMVHCRYFGDYTNQRLASSFCYIFSEEIPTNEHGPGIGSTFDLALKVGLYRLS